MKQSTREPRGQLHICFLKKNNYSYFLNLLVKCLCQVFVNPVVNDFVIVVFACWFLENPSQVLVSVWFNGMIVNLGFYLFGCLVGKCENITSDVGLID